MTKLLQNIGTTTNQTIKYVLPQPESNHIFTKRSEGDQIERKAQEIEFHSICFPRSIHNISFPRSIYHSNKTTMTEHDEIMSEYLSLFKGPLLSFDGNDADDDSRSYSSIEDVERVSL